MTFLKKLGCIISASAFLASSCITASAVELKAENDSDSVNVTAKYSAGTVSDVYSVDIEWGSMAFEYTEENRVWNPETHKYDTSGSSGWSCADGANKVKVTNHSNNPVTVELSYTPSADYSEISGEFDIPEKTLEAAAENSSLDSAPSFTAALSLEGELSESVTSSTVIGSAKVTLKSGTNGGENSGEQNDGEQEDSLGEMDKSKECGKVIISTVEGWEDGPYVTSIYDQGDNVYEAELFVTSVPSDEDRPKSEIYINKENIETKYHIYEEGAGFKFKPGKENSVEIKTTPYPDLDGTIKRKVIAIEPNKTYRLIIKLNDDGESGMATLIEIKN